MFESLEKGIRVSEEHNASYSEIRAEDMIVTFIGYADGRIDNLNYRFRSGVACRVLCDGMWGFTCGRIEDVSSLMERACGLARAAARHRKEQIM
ncbi:MAG: TldD/PmbA family protein, partial [Theionarchaea archaeon]|nr:TldD/PmbA family protein [Theionarchaea archaeon]